FSNQQSIAEVTGSCTTSLQRDIVRLLVLQEPCIGKRSRNRAITSSERAGVVPPSRCRFGAPAFPGQCNDALQTRSGLRSLECVAAWRVQSLRGFRILRRAATATGIGSRGRECWCHPREPWRMFLPEGFQGGHRLHPRSRPLIVRER